MEAGPDILKGGVGAVTVDQLRRLIQDKTQEERKLADPAWQKGLEQAKRTWTTTLGFGSW